VKGQLKAAALNGTFIYFSAICSIAIKTVIDFEFQFNYFLEQIELRRVHFVDGWQAVELHQNICPSHFDRLSKPTILPSFSSRALLGPSFVRSMHFIVAQSSPACRCNANEMSFPAIYRKVDGSG
jgi:hypothetical protein